MGDADHGVPEPEGEKHLGGAGNEGTDAHPTTLARAGYPHPGRRRQPHWKTQGAFIVLKATKDQRERVKHDPLGRRRNPK
jgi:hypothetical protein